MEALTYDIRCGDRRISICAGRAQTPRIEHEARLARAKTRVSAPTVRRSGTFRRRRGRRPRSRVRTGNAGVADEYPLDLRVTFASLASLGFGLSGRPSGAEVGTPSGTRSAFSSAIRSLRSVHYSFTPMKPCSSEQGLPFAREYAEIAPVRSTRFTCLRTLSAAWALGDVVASNNARGPLREPGCAQQAATRMPTFTASPGFSTRTCSRGTRRSEV